VGDRRGDRFAVLPHRDPRCDRRTVPRRRNRRALPTASSTRAAAVGRSFSATSSLCSRPARPSSS